MLPTKIAYKNIALFTLLVVIMLDNLGIGLIYPILPELFMTNGNGLFTADKITPSLQSFYYGLAFACMQIGSFIGIPFLGNLSDKFGRKPILIIGLSGLVISYFTCALAVTFHSYWFFVLARFISGISAGTISIAQAVIADINPNPDAKMYEFSLPILASILGFIIGPILGIFAVDILTDNNLNLARPFWIPGILAIINLVFLCLFFKETLTKKNPTLKSSWLKDIATFLFIFKDKRIKILGLVYLIYQFGYNNYLQSISAVARNYMGLSTVTIHILFSIAAFCYIIGILLIKLFTAKKIDLFKKINLFLATLGIGIIIAGSFFTLNIQVISLILICISGFFLSIIILTLCSNAVTVDEQGKVMGGVGSLNALAGALSAIFISLTLGSSPKFLLIFSGFIIFTGIYVHLRKK